MCDEVAHTGPAGGASKGSATEAPPCKIPNPVTCLKHPQGHAARSSANSSLAHNNPSQHTPKPAGPENQQINVRLQQRLGGWGKLPQLNGRRILYKRLRHPIPYPELSGTRWKPPQRHTRRVGANGLLLKDPDRVETLFLPSSAYQEFHDRPE
jgi:hypothetical protein